MAGLNSILSLKNRVYEASQNLINGTYMQMAVTNNASAIIEANQDQLYELGHNPLGISIGSYAPKTITIKKDKGQPYDRVTLKDTGDFYAGFHLDADNTGFRISSTDWKTEELLERWGNVFGLTEENRLRISWSLFFPFLIKTVREVIF